MGQYEWVHVPKTGSSFENTLIRWACGQDAPNVNVFSGRPNMQARKGAQSSILNSRADCLRRTFVHRTDAATGRVKSDMAIGTHMPLRGDESPSELQRVFMLFRSPDARAWSEFKQNYVLTGQICQSCITPSDMCGVYDRFGRAHMAKYILGCHPLRVCKNQTLPAASIHRACAKVQHMGFIGITELWRTSICVFHETLGGENDERDLHNSRPGLSNWKAPPSVRNRRNCTDRGDAALFVCALREFLRRAHQTRCDVFLHDTELHLPAANELLHRALIQQQRNRPSAAASTSLPLNEGMGKGVQSMQTDREH